MVTIRIKDHVQYAYTYDEGQEIFDLIKPSLDSGKPVVLSFEGIKAVPSSFLNAALLQLCDSLTHKEIRELLRIESSTDYINEMIRRGFETVEMKKKKNNPE